MIKSLKIPGSYVLDFTGRVKLGDMPELMLYDRLRDGRIMGLLAEDIISHEFGGITRVKGNGASFDLVKADERIPTRLQCKSFNGTSVDLAPSSMKGKGRKFNFDLFMDYCESFDAWLFIDIAAFPKMVVHAVTMDTVMKLAQVTNASAKLKMSAFK